MDFQILWGKLSDSSADSEMRVTDPESVRMAMASTYITAPRGERERAQGNGTAVREGRHVIAVSSEKPMAYSIQTSFLNQAAR